MNQFQSILRSILKFVGAYFIAHGHATTGNWIQLHDTPQDIGYVFTGLGLAWSYFAHAGSGSNSGGASTSVVLAFLLPAFAMFPGCSSAPATAYKVEASTDATVSAAMTAWGVYVAQYHPGTNAEMEVESAFNKYQQAELAAIDATQVYLALTSTNAATDAGPVNAAAQSAAAALTDLLNLVVSFGVKF